MTKGSEWRKWNFHVHTKGTNKNDQFTSSTMEDFFYTFFKGAYDNQVTAIGITDYFSIDRYLDALEYKKNIKDKVDDTGSKLFKDEEIIFIEKIFLFPNVELRISPATKKGKFINLHFIFNPDYVSSLSNAFFNKIKNMDGYLMNKQGFKDYAKHLDPNIHEDAQYKFGLDNYNIEVGVIKDLINNSKELRENSIIAVSSKSNDGISGLKDYYNEFESEGGSLLGTIKSIYRVTQVIFSGAPSDKEYFLGKKTSIEEVENHTGSLKPCIIGCDAHTEDELFMKFTWVKADLSFEGLRQICLEPEQRVRQQPDMPDFKEDKLLIDKVRFVSPNNFFSTNSIHLNPNLNVIIGGKSSGKSILLFAIAKTLSADEAVLKNDDDTFRYDFDEIEPDFDFEIITRGGFNQKLKRDSSENSILPEVKYIPQSYLVKLAEPELNKKGKSLNKLVRDLIKEDNVSKEAYQNFINKVQQNDKARNAQIDLFFETRKEIDSLEIELKTKSNKAVLEQNIQANVEKVEDLNKSTGLTEEQIAEYKALQIKQDNNNANRQKLANDVFAVSKFNTELVQALSNLKQKKDALLETLQVAEIKEHYQNEYAGIDALLEQSNIIETSLELRKNEEGRNYFVNDCKFKEIIDSLTQEAQQLKSLIEPYLKDEQTRKIIEGLNESIANDKKAVLDIETLSKQIQEKKKFLDDSKNKIFEIYENNYQEYSLILGHLKHRTLELEKDGLGIVGKAQYNFKNLRRELLAVSDGRTASYTQYSILSEDKKATDEAVFSDIFNEVKKLFDDIVAGKYALTSRTSIPAAVRLVLDDYFFDYWEITYKQDKLGKMSTGKASFVILMLIIGLSKSKAPILIDQPEDNLDNRSITADLVNYLRNKKLERQIIIVTHNANIVVNADAENVIVANQRGQNDDYSSSIFKFDYINGAIENSFDKIPSETDILKSMGIRQHIADIVEGGKEAFIMREKKYRFH